MHALVSAALKRNGGSGGFLKQIAVVSGKGGTGKTTITASFAALTHESVIADCDVDAATLHLLLHPQKIEEREFKGSKLAVIDRTMCNECGLCTNACRFGAISKDFRIDSFMCEGCGVCSFVCPEEAISLQERSSGHAYISRTKYGIMLHARLIPGEANSGKLVALVRHNARHIAEEEVRDLILIDGPPGIGCPAIASVSGVDVGLVVTEPTLSGIHDLKRALQLLNHFNVKPFVCVNKYDINRKNTGKVTEFCDKNGVEVIGNIPFNPVVTDAMVNGKPVVEYASESDVSTEIAKMWQNLLSQQSLKKGLAADFW